MWIKFDDESVRLTGRWAVCGEAAAATAAGAYLEAAFQGGMAVLHFDTAYSAEPYPHVWIGVDGGAFAEAPLDRFLRINAPGPGRHVVRVIYKGAMEMQHRWRHPLVGKIAFLGLEADAPDALEPDHRRTIEFVGDSITEGVLIDAGYRTHANDQWDRPCQDDVTAGYAWLTARALDLRPIMMGYGAVGSTKSGCGGVPKAAEAYPYCFEDAPISHSADFIVVNHGTNDRDAAPEAFRKEYRHLLEVILQANPHSRLAVMLPFCGAFPKEIRETAAEAGRDTGREILVVDTAGWLPAEPLHPLRDGHRSAAERLTAALRQGFGL